MVLPIAHAGHWVLWVLYLAPVVIVLGAVVRAFVHERRARRDQGSAGGGAAASER